MQALVLAVRPARVTSYAIVQGTAVYDADSWHLLAEVKTTGPRATPADRLVPLMERRLGDVIEGFALTYPLDAIVIGLADDPACGAEADALCGAVERAALRASTWYRMVAAELWREELADRHDLTDVVAAARAVSGSWKRSRAKIDSREAAEAVMMGVHASGHLGIPCLDAMPDGECPD